VKVLDKQERLALLALLDKQEILACSANVWGRAELSGTTLDSFAF
jgi:hypothetical protein